MQIVYNREVHVFIKKLEKRSQSKVLQNIDLLETYGQNLRMPYVKKMTNVLYELRISGQQSVRIFFAFYDGQIFLIHGFIKKTQKTPKKEIFTAERRYRLFTKI